MTNTRQKNFQVNLGIVLSKFIPSGILLPIVRGPLRGYKWIVGAAAGPAKGISVVVNMFEPDQLKTAQSLLSSDKICFDLGANVGLYTLLFAKHAKHVFAFEPLPRNISYLSRTLQTNKIVNVTIVPWAVADYTGLYSFQEGDNVALGKLETTGTQPVATVSLDEFVARYKVMPSLIKIDVEGAELSVLKGAEKTLSNRPHILLSTHSDELKTECFHFLETKNYTNFIALNANAVGEASEFVITSSLIHIPQV